MQPAHAPTFLFSCNAPGRLHGARGARCCGPAREPTTVARCAHRLQRATGLPWRLQNLRLSHETFISVAPHLSASSTASLALAWPSLHDIVWVDFHLAVGVFVLVPLGILFASFRNGDAHDALKRVMIGYWQASSLLMLTVFLNIAQQPIGYTTALAVQIIIPTMLYWWRDLDNEVRGLAAGGSLLERIFLLWRPAAAALGAMGALMQLTTQRCALLSSGELLDDAMCAAWLEPPFEFYNLHVGTLLGGSVPEWVFGAMGYAGLSVYASYLSYLLFMVLPRVGRQGRAPRTGLFTSVALLHSWGWLSDNNEA